jgi:cysteine desulfurase/selenocysteine lyase
MIGGSMRIYLDNAATSFPKPPAVVEAMRQYLSEIGAPAGRGAYRAALDVGRTIGHCRQSAAQLFGVSDPARIVFTFNGTDGLNTAILGTCRPGNHVVTSTWEHNSVLRPLRALQEQRNVAVTRVEPDQRGILDPVAIESALQPHTRLVAVQHVSNVTGVIQPLEDLAAVVRKHGAFLLVDAAQSAGHFPIDLAALGVDLWACSGHKGLLGPLGTGLLYVGPRAEAELQPLRWGGTGTHSEDDIQPGELPDRYESGNLNVPGIVGLDAALTELQQRGLQALRDHEVQLTQRLWDALSSLSGVKLFGPSPHDVPRTGIVSLQLASLAPQEAAAVLDEHFGIECRSGLHCAPGVHRALGTLETGGTLRFSVGVFNTEEHIDQTVDAMKALVG